MTLAGVGGWQELQGGQKAEKGSSLEEGPLDPIPLTFIYSDIY